MNLTAMAAQARTESDRLYLQAARLCVRASWVWASSREGWGGVRDMHHAAELLEAATTYLLVRADLPNREAK